MTPIRSFARPLLVATLAVAVVGTSGCSWLRSKFGARVYHDNQQLAGPPVLLVVDSDRGFDAHLWLCAWLLSDAGCAVEVFDWPLPAGELALAVEHLQPRAVLLYSSQALNTNHLQRLLAGYDCPCLITGQAVQIHQQELSGMADQNPDLSLAADPLAALQILTDLNLLNS